MQITRTTNKSFLSAFIIFYFIIELAAFNLLEFQRTRRQANCGFRCNSGTCINADNECDGKADCGDHSDETINCQRIRCPKYLFRCNYGACVDPNSECDGKKDCDDNSDETSARCKRGASNNCSSKQFQCSSGNCIHEDKKCDGTVDCLQDGSDETAETCSSMRCPGFAYRCAYGACVDGDSKCNGVRECADGSDENPVDCRGNIPAPTTSTTIKPVVSSGSCILPQHPPYGEWVIPGGSPNFRPGNPVDSSTILQLKCNKQHKGVGNKLIFCQNGKWSGLLGECKKLCPPLKSTDTMTVTCRLGDYPANCQEPESSTIATFKCKQYYEDPSRNLIRICTDGSWDLMQPNCIPECGRKTPRAQTLIIGGKAAKESDYPWQVALYLKKPDRKAFICGGSLLSEKVVLTAAHCITGIDGGLYPKQNYMVAVGKFYRKFDDPRDTDAQFSELQEMFVPSEYRAENQNYLGDIAILITATIFKISRKVQPICIRTDGSYESEVFENGKKGIVTGWGLVDTNEKIEATQLQELETPYISHDQCYSELSEEFQRYFTHDKICSGYLNQSLGVCQGDSGGGLVFKNAYDQRYYVEGVVSVSPRNDAGTCDIQQYSLYTKVSKYINFIIEKRSQYKP